MVYFLLLQKNQTIANAQRHSSVSAALNSLLQPVQVGPFFLVHAIAEIEVDQRLVGNAGIFGQRFEVGNHVFAHSYRDLALESGRIGIFP